MTIQAVTFSIDVPDIQAALDFYQRGLGFHAKEKLTDTIYLLEAAGVRMFLLERAAGSTPTPDERNTRSYLRHWTPLHLDLEVDNLKAALDQALAAGATLESQSESEQWGAIAGCADPFGNGFCLIQPPKST